MEDEIDALDGGLDVMVGRKGAFEELDPALHFGKVLPFPGGKVVEHPNASAALEEEPNQMGPDEPGSAGHEIRGQIAAFLEVSSV
jgi:hypothetical protein